MENPETFPFFYRLQAPKSSPLRLMSAVSLLAVASMLIYFGVMVDETGNLRGQIRARKYSLRLADLSHADIKRKNGTVQLWLRDKMGKQWMLIGYYGVWSDEAEERFKKAIAPYGVEWGIEVPGK